MNRLLLVWIFLYVVTGAISPTLVDWLARTGRAGDALGLWPVLASSTGMLLSKSLNEGITKFYRLVKSKSTYFSLSKSGAILDYLVEPTGPASGGGLRRLACFDLLSTSLVMIGLMHVGSGTYTVIYSSGIAWTAILSYCRGASRLNQRQWIAVGIVTLGIVANGAGHWFDDEDRGESDSRLFYAALLCLIAGTVMHAVVLILIDEASRGSQTEALRVGMAMGQTQVGILIAWNLLRYTLTQPQESWTLLTLVGYGFLMINQAVHAVAFFSMIGGLGAVGSCVLKGFLALSVFGFSAAMFCDAQHSEACLSPLKGASMVFVFTGGIMYGVASTYAGEKRKVVETV